MIEEKSKILIVDDDIENIKLIGNFLRNENYLLGIASDGLQALKLLEGAKDYDLVLLDINMPNMNGLDVCRVMKSNQLLKDIPIIFFSANNDIEFIVEGFEAGANDYIVKPVKKRELLARISTHLRLKKAEKSLVESIKEKDRLLVSEQQLLDKTLKGSIKMLIDILSMVTPLNLFPNKKVTENVRTIAKGLKLTNAWELEITVLLSKLGCISIPVEVLNNKLNGKKLSKEQNRMFMQHPELGKKLLANIPRFENIAESIYYQFKNYDGTGYPNDNVLGESIPLFARILTVVNDIEEYNMNGNSKIDNLKLMKSNLSKYDPEILKLVTIDMFVENKENIMTYTIDRDYKNDSEYINNPHLYYQRNDIFGSQKHEKLFNVELIPISSAKDGMVLAESMTNINGLVVLRRGIEINSVIIKSLNHLSNIGSINGTIKVYNDNIKNT